MWANKGDHDDAVDIGEELLVGCGIFDNGSDGQVALANDSDDEVEHKHEAQEVVQQQVHHH